MENNQNHLNRRKAIQLALICAGTVSSIGLFACSNINPDINFLNKGLEDFSANYYPREKISEGGNFRYWLDQAIPPNLNFYQIDGWYKSLDIIYPALFPVPYLLNPQGDPNLNPLFLSRESNLELSGDGQIVTYHIKPGIFFTNGEEVTWKEFSTIWKMCNGRTSGSIPSVTQGYDQISNIEPGETKYEVKVTFSSIFPDWKYLFPFIYPSSSIDTVEKFNTGWINKIPATCGPFKLDSIDTSKAQITLSRDNKWHGPSAKLDKIIMSTMDYTAWASAFKNNEIDNIQVESLSSLKTVYESNLRYQRGLDPAWYGIAFNGGHNRTLSDIRIRRALQWAINSELIANISQKGIAKKPTLLGNHIYLIGTDGYKDNRGQWVYNPDRAKQELESSGYTKDADGFYAKNGKEIFLELLTRSDNLVQNTIAQVVLQNLLDFGIKTRINAVPSTQFYSDYYFKGLYDLATTGLSNPPSQFLGATPTYELPCLTPQDTIDNSKPCNFASNTGMIGTNQINQEFTEGLKTLNKTKQIQIGNEIDVQLWDIAHTLLLYQRIEIYVTRKNIANWGPNLLGTYSWENIGFVK